MKKTYIVLTSIFLILGATLVIAWAIDSDGGYNIYQQGTCIDQYGNHTDVCNLINPVGESNLKEWYPSSNNTNATCVYARVNCKNYNLTCSAGACV